MKNFRKWFPLTLAFLFIFTLSNCVEKDKKPQKEEKPKTEEETDISNEPRGIISLDEAKVLCDNYENRRLKSIIDFERANNESGEKFVPTQFIDFELKTIKKYIKYVEKEAKKAKVKPDSIRIYLGNYGTDGRDPNRNTVFILPTATVDGDHGGFFINANGSAELIRNSWSQNEDQGQQKSKASIFSPPSINLFNEQSLILNLGHGGPPPTGDF